MVKFIVLVVFITIVYGVPLAPTPPTTSGTPTSSEISKTSETVTSSEAPTTIITPTSNRIRSTPVIHPAATLPALQQEVRSYKKKPIDVPISETELKPSAAIIKAVNGEVDPKNEKDDLEEAEFGWRFAAGLVNFAFQARSYGGQYPSYPTYYPEYYPVYYQPYEEYSF